MDGETTATRAITHRYADPLEVVWLEAARRIGVRVERSDVAYAWSDGRGTLVLGSPETLDPDDCLAQMIFHELCHSLVQGPDSFGQPDWGLDNESERDLHREHACLRAQAWLAGRHGLREVLAPTTHHRVFYDALRPDPLESDPALAGEPTSVQLARLAIARSDRAPWAPHLADALGATRRIVGASAQHAPRASLFALWREPSPPHPTGLPAHPDPAGRTCGDCAWSAPGRRRARCTRVGAPIDPSWSACERFDASLDCQTCAACCREAYQRVELSRRDPFVRAHPELVRRIEGRLVLQRVEGRCPALEGEGPYSCRHYEERPRTCRDFQRGGDHCREARRRVGLSL